ncbi:MAG: hypothetical protein U0003_03120 [Vampirovibrionales bacterium]
MTDTNSNQPAAVSEDFEVNETDVPWFLWVFFGLIICWASISWLPLFGY